MRSRLALPIIISLLLVACSGSPAGVTPSASATSASQSSGTAAQATAAAEPTPTQKEADAVTAPADTEAYPAPQVATSPTKQGEAYPAAEGQATTAGGLPTADGVIATDEYAHQGKIGPVTLYWSNDDQFLFLAVEAPTQGWLGVGLNPEDRMKGANYLIAADRDGLPTLYDAYGQGATGATHPEDTQLGGTTDIVASAVFRQDGVTRFEAQIMLASGDQYDGVLAPGGTYPVIVATGTSAQFSAPHNYRGLGEITLD